ncbi:hypothetical protein [Caulobacter sp. NIBR1757]|uniref:hypothetical protein n=1 Tax=Caulobacter sp. NIBR1757 TaxID=3016000 RepID=UPI0022F02F8B|nr:hypothetical protein [Caulobacter sp. NIBR1757]WGM38388.1 hypothetical protein AMEJIAPC_01291 [Caulobacter sp. NIBR1757]
MPFPASIDVSNLGAAGTVINGANVYDLAGLALTAAGDVNGDGIGDFIVGASAADPNGNSSGVVYVVFGVQGGLPSTLNLASLNGANGFAIHGGAALELAGYSVSGGGDFNGDGLADIAIGAPGVANGGAAYIVFGSSQPFAPVVELDALGADEGLVVIMDDAHGDLGDSVALAGDLNGDGFDDLVIGAPAALTVQGHAGQVVVVFGTNAVGAGSLTVIDLDGNNGFAIEGAIIDGGIGNSVSMAGDVNGDGIDDLLFSTSGLETGLGGWGGVYVIYGRSSGLDSTDLDKLTSDRGFFIASSDPDHNIGDDVALVGDINGDGLADILLQSGAGDDEAAAFVVFGRSDQPDVIDLEALTGADGFRLATPYPNIGFGAVGAAGDVNGDGLADLVLGAVGVLDVDGYSVGFGMVIFGQQTPFDAVVDPLALGAGGVQLPGATRLVDFGTRVSGAGDVNGDGLDDFLIAAPRAYGDAAASGVVYLVYGVQSALNLTGGSGPDTLDGASAGDTLDGGDGGDTLNGLGGDDTLIGGGGQDLLNGGSGKDILRGGDGFDTLNGGDGNDNLFGGDVFDFLNGDAGNDNLFGEGGTDFLWGGDGADKLSGGADSDTLRGEAGIDRLEGGDDNDFLFGGDANDLLDGGAGSDMMTGGLGNDVYIVDDADQTTEAAGEGYDIVRSFAAAWALGDNIEGLELQGSGNLIGIGNALSNNMQGNSGNNILSGGDGVDTINGNDGDDTIIGGAGNDLLRGGLGADTFVVQSIGGGVLRVDVIYDFSTAENDRIDFSSIDANTGLADDQAFTLVGAFTRHAGEMTLSFTAGQTLVRLDVTGDGKADYQMKINGDVTGDSGGWLL